MFDDLIDTFIQVVQYGSFSKTADSMFLTPNAIKKRIQALEEQTNLLLFVRNNKGVSLTEAGTSFYHDILSIHKQYEKAIEKAQHIQHTSTDRLCIGIMNTFSDTFATSRWNEVRKNSPNIPIHIQYYGNNLSEMDNLFSDVGTYTDLCIDICDPDWAKQHHLELQKISDFRLFIAIPDSLKLTHSETITLSELAGHQLALLPLGRSYIYDQVRELVNSKYPDVHLIDMAEFSIRNFNDCYSEQTCILITENQVNFFPYFSFHPLEGSSRIAFGAYYPPNPPEKVSKFLNLILQNQKICDL